MSSQDKMTSHASTGSLNGKLGVIIASDTDKHNMSQDMQADELDADFFEKRKRKRSKDDWFL